MPQRGGRIICLASPISPSKTPLRRSTISRRMPRQTDLQSDQDRHHLRHVRHDDLKIQIGQHHAKPPPWPCISASRAIAGHSSWKCPQRSVMLRQPSTRTRNVGLCLLPISLSIRPQFPQTDYCPITSLPARSSARCKAAGRAAISTMCMSGLGWR